MYNIRRTCQAPSSTETENNLRFAESEFLSRHWMSSRSWTETGRKNLYEVTGGGTVNRVVASSDMSAKTEIKYVLKPLLREERLPGLDDMFWKTERPE